MRKPRILWVNEASFLHTGYAVYGREIISRLHKTGKYELAELGCYGHVPPTVDEIGDYTKHLGMPQMYDIPWRYYGNMFKYNDRKQEDEYRSVPTNQFGEWRFERVCLDFKPDIVVDIRDWWMTEFIERSPYRPYFHWSIMPTVDSEPQQEQYLSTFLSADSVFAYSEYGRDVLLRETNSKIKFIDVASPGANLEVMKPHPDKIKLRSQFGIVEDANIIGTVMRNQARKLYPDLFEGFKFFLDKIADKDTANKTYLYIHTSFPDSGWDIPYWLRYFDLGNKVLFTYKCMNCQHVFPAFFRDARTVCRRCGAAAAKLPNTVKGLSDEELAGVYNLFDLYVQYSVCEGFGMPQVEAAACGVPVMAVNYSAMESVVKNLGGIPINVGRYFYDSGTGSKRALPDNADFAEKLKSFLAKPKQVRQKLGRDHYNKVKKIYNYDRIADIWAKHFDSIELKDSWNSTPRIHEPQFDIPPNLNNEEFIRWCIKNVWGEPEHLNSFIAMKFLRDLNYGEAIKGTGELMYNEASYLSHNNKYQNFSHQDAAQNFARLAEKRNYFEKLRVGMITEKVPDYIRMVKKEE